MNFQNSSIIIKKAKKFANKKESAHYWNTLFLICVVMLLSSHLVFFKTSFAINRTIALWDERNLGFNATAGTSYLGKAWTMSVLLLSAAILTALWRLKSFISEKLLFFCCKFKLVATILACELLIIHVYEKLM